MTHPLPPDAPDPARRRVVASSLGLGTAAAFGAGLAGCQPGPGGEGELQFTALPAAEAALSRLAQAGALESRAAWNWSQTLVHCAQSIEYSMSGYPQSKPAWFQRSVGAAAFGVFSWRGRMSHDLAEPIPGAPALDAQAPTVEALARLRASIAAFQAWTGPLKPHFAYGPLDHADYERAHAMHLASHLSLFRVRA